MTPSPPTEPPDLNLRMTATAPGVMLVRQVLGGVADAQSWDESFAGDVKLAVTEACNNVVVHAYDDASPGELRLRLWAEDDAVVVAVGDDGVGMDGSSATQRPGLGLGLPLMKDLAEEIAILREEGRSTEVVMRFTGARGEVDA